jgi:NAD(P)-dependent dehydrogenase (short-subunit alcohol dehydrogenase family)
VIVLVAGAASEEVSQLADGLGGPERLVLLTPQSRPGVSADMPVVEADLLSAQGTAAGWQLLEETYGPAHGLVVVPSPVATTTPISFADISDALWSSTMENLTMAMHAARAAAGPMMTRGEGRIVLVAWRLDEPAGLVPLTTVSGAICQFARGLATEVGERGVTVNAVSVAPGRLADASPIARFLCSADSGYLTAEVVAPGDTTLARR